MSEKDKNSDKKPLHKIMKRKAVNQMIIEVEGLEGRLYSLHMPFNAPLPECYEAGIAALAEIKDIYDAAIEQQKKERKKEEKSKDN